MKALEATHHSEALVVLGLEFDAIMGIRAEFESAFVSDISTWLAVLECSVHVLSIAAGSVHVRFAVSNGPGVTSHPYPSVLVPTVERARLLRWMRWQLLALLLSLNCYRGHWQLL